MNSSNGTRRPLIGEALGWDDSSHPDAIPERGDDILMLDGTNHGIGEVNIPSQTPTLFTEVKSERDARRGLVKAALRHGFAVYDNYTNGIGATATLITRECGINDIVIVWCHGRVETLRQAQCFGSVVVAITTGGILTEV
jgi:hypothetical protein